MRFDRFLTRCLSLLTLGGMLGGNLSAQTIYYPGFSTTVGLSHNGDASSTTTGDGTVLRLATANASSAGSVFTTAQYSTAGFSTAFQFRLSSPGGITDGQESGADGLTFVLQRAGFTSVGGIGQGLGYDGISSSLAVEFDTFRNSVDPLLSNGGSNHVGIDTNGSISSLATAAVATRFDNGAVWTAWIDYNGTTLEVRVSDSGLRPASALLTQSLNLASTVGGSTAFVGFTGATGGAFENHDILNWNYSSTFVTGGVSAVPEPDAAWLLALGAVVLGGRRLVRRAR